MLKPSVLKPLIATVDQNLIRRKLGHLQAEDQQSLSDVLRAIVGP